MGDNEAHRFYCIADGDNDPRCRNPQGRWTQGKVFRMHKFINKLSHNRFSVGKTYIGNSQTHKGSPRKIGYVLESVI